MARVRRNERTRRKKAGAHRKVPARRTALASSVAAGGAALGIGAASYLGAPTAEALSILLPGPEVDGAGSATRVNILEGNVFNPQISASGNNSSTNMIIGGAALNRLYGFIDRLLSIQINLSGTDGSNVGTRVNIASYNVFNPQLSLSGANVANNVKVANVTMDNGNNAVADGAGGQGNGNTAQFSLLSGNIFNPQTSLTGANISNNVTVTNVAMNNGNGSQSISSMGNPLGSFVFGGGNGNSHQYGSFVSNISNPQWTWGGGNTSNNSAITNTADGNGNGSTNTVTGGGTVVTGTGNGNTNQAASGSGNIYNDQVNIGPGGRGAGGSTTAGPKDLDDVISLVSASRTEGARSVATGGTGRINRQSQQERRNLFSLNRIAGLTAARNTSASATSNDTNHGGHPTGQPTGGAGATGGGSVGTGNGEASDSGGDGNGDSDA